MYVQVYAVCVFTHVNMIVAFFQLIFITFASCLFLFLGNFLWYKENGNNNYSSCT